MFHLKKLEKQEQTNFKIRRKEIIKIRPKINKMETKKIQKINKMNSCLLKKNKIDKPLAMPIKEKKTTWINKIRDEKGGITTNTTEIQKIIRDNYEQLNINKLENLT